MNMDPRVALNALTTAHEEHLSASVSRRGDEDPTVESAFYSVADAFEAYEDALFAATGEVTPLDLYDEEGDADDLLDDEEDEEEEALPEEEDLLDEDEQ